jgi:hypothetical protein
MEDLYETHDYRAKQMYPSIQTQSKMYEAGIQFKVCME